MIATLLNCSVSIDSEDLVWATVEKETGEKSNKSGVRKVYTVGKMAMKVLQVLPNTLSNMYVPLVCVCGVSGIG